MPDRLTPEEFAVLREYAVSRPHSDIGYVFAELDEARAIARRLGTALDHTLSELRHDEDFAPDADAYDAFITLPWAQDDA